MKTSSDDSSHRKRKNLNQSRKRFLRESASEPDRGKRDGGRLRRAEHGEFRCRNCRHVIGPPLAGTTQRNHCPVCLHSLHLDDNPGDRQSTCGSMMEPIAIWVRGDEWVLLHRCRGCGSIKSNRVAPDDNEVLLISLAVKPLGQPAFPLGDVNLWRLNRE